MEVLLDVFSFVGGVLAALGIGGVVGLALAALAIWRAPALLDLLIRASIARHGTERREHGELETLLRGISLGLLQAREDSPSQRLTLLVRFDEQSGRFCPSVQIRGWDVLALAWIRLELVDRDGAVRLVKRKRLAGTAIGTELPLPAFKAPEGASADEVLGWHWDIVIEDKGAERARWRQQPRPADQLNAEAELA